MGSSSSKPETHVTPNETTFFANRKPSPVKFDDALLSQLTSSADGPLPSSRQSSLDSAIQAKLASELKRLQQQEADVRAEISRALEKENLDRERGATQEAGGVLNSASLATSLAELEARVRKLKDEREKNAKGEQWSKLDGERKSLVECFLANKTTPLNCKEAADNFRAAVNEVEKSFVTAL